MAQSLIYQAINDGTIVIAEQMERYSDNQLKLTFEHAVKKGSWNAELISQENGLLIYNVNVGSITFGLYLYLNNVRSSSRGRAKEQRIQLNSNISSRGFNFVNSKMNKCVILGIYRGENEDIFCAWDAEKKNNHGKQKSCYIDIESIALAMRNGFYCKRDNAGDVVCAFKPDFIHYYLMNLEKLHE